MTTFDKLEPALRTMEATAPVVARSARRGAAKPRFNEVHHLTDATTGRTYRVEYLVGASGKLARVRGRVALTLDDLPEDLRALPKVRADGRYEHVYERALKDVQGFTDRPTWYQPMFKRRHVETCDDGTKQNCVTWYGKLGSYWDPAVAAVAAELAAARHAEGKDRAAIEAVEADLLQAARAYALSQTLMGKRRRR
jgi:hypothetical protein